MDLINESKKPWDAEQQQMASTGHVMIPYKWLVDNTPCSNSVRHLLSFLLTLFSARNNSLTNFFWQNLGNTPALCVNKFLTALLSSLWTNSTWKEQWIILIHNNFIRPQGLVFWSILCYDIFNFWNRETNKNFKFEQKHKIKQKFWFSQ